MNRDPLRTTPGTADGATHPHRPDASPNAELIRSAYRAFHTRDLPALLGTLAPDVRWVHPDSMSAYGLGGVKHGHAGVREFLARVPRVLGGMRLEPQEFVECGDRVVVFGERDVTSLSGRTERLKFVHSWTLRDGRVAVMEDVFDTALLHELIEG
ncbi:nuclear transport factor 2 family protein [Streptomyces sennicomposti]